MPPQEQADLWMALRDRMKKDWNDMTMQEKKAGTPIILSRLVDSKTTSISSSMLLCCGCIRCC